MTRAATAMKCARSRQSVCSLWISFIQASLTSAVGCKVCPARSPENWNRARRLSSA